MLADISNYENIYDNVLIFFAILMVDVFIVFLTRYFPDVFGKALNEWYTTFKFTAILSDILIILLGFVIARYIYTIFIRPIYGWNPLIFLALLVAIQVIHDILFYLVVILPIPVGHSQIIDLFKRYSSSAGPKIIGGDAVIMVLSALVAMYYKSQPVHIVTAASILALYNASYMLYRTPL